jgi:hypothetical protein
VRKDLSFSQQVVQAAHAAIESAHHLIPSDIDHPHLVVCGVKDLDQLERAADRLDKAEIRYRVFYEADIGDEPTALATEPIYGDDRRHFKRFNCLKIPAQEVCAVGG